MKKFSLLLTFAALFFGVMISTARAQWNDFTGTEEMDAFLEQAEFEGIFEVCFEDTSGFLEEDKQCQCIFRVTESVLTPEDYQRAQALKDEGRTGSAKKIFKKALKEAFNQCY